MLDKHTMTQLIDAANVQHNEDPDPGHRAFYMGMWVALSAIHLLMDGEIETANKKFLTYLHTEVQPD
jgi:hypothetical protein